ncbi:MAG: inorganic phosphate transporter [Candidatus Cloacimonadaceae bacterium]|jgi:PiT family inorganic phosphate transporter|nr:inorganic phosphate transporter family protein [Candidatus Cloacimonadota bacterium]MCK9179063.1 inorganic phosphate transporter family protein [Candidatus Cloacimonadota bacterium]MDD3533527.1 inorganic phosphate transporter [Candidatus Cloacimonadota bacterium]MDY0128300.1 inorganic phosphate transporter [Candidatus Cloacimonadaceae bacterium]
MFFFYLLSGLFLGWSLGANDTGNIFGPAIETRMLTFKKAALIASVFITLGAVFEGGGPSATLGKLGSVDAMGGAFTVALAAALSITLIVRTGIPVSTSQTIVGSIIAWNVFSGRLTDYRSILTIAASWVIAFVLSATIAALLFHLVRPFVNRSKLHLLKQDLIVRYGLTIVGAFGAYSLGANNIANVVGVFVPVSPFKDIYIGSHFVFKGVQQLYLLGALSIVVGIYTYSHKVMRTVGRDLFRLSPITALIALFAEAIVLFLFASKGLYNLLLSLGLPTIPLVPVSSTQVIVGAVVGIGLAKGGKNIRYNILGKISLAWVTAPVMAFMISFALLFIMQNVFEQKVQQETNYIFDRQSITKIVEDGFDSVALSTVNGRSFTSEQDIYNELSEEHLLSRNQIMQIIQIAELYPLKVDTVKLTQSGIHQSFSKEQLQVLRQYEGKTYRHKWQLKQELIKHPEFKNYATEVNEVQKDHNRKLDSKLDLLYRSFRALDDKK